MPGDKLSAHRDAGQPLLCRHAADEVIEPLREHAPEESIYYLNPLPYSKLQ